MGRNLAWNQFIAYQHLVDRLTFPGWDAADDATPALERLAGVIKAMQDERACFPERFKKRAIPEETDGRDPMLCDPSDE